MSVSKGDEKECNELISFSLKESSSLSLPFFCHNAAVPMTCNVAATFQVCYVIAVLIRITKSSHYCTPLTGRQKPLPHTQPSSYQTLDSRMCSTNWTTKFPSFHQEKGLHLWPSPDYRWKAIVNFCCLSHWVKCL